MQPMVPYSFLQGLLSLAAYLIVPEPGPGVVEAVVVPVHIPGT
jgi:hypothetical protein